MRTADYRSVSRALRRQERLHRETRRMMIVAIVVFVLSILVNVRAFAAAYGDGSPSGGATTAPPAVPVGIASSPGGASRSTVTLAPDVTSTTTTRRRRPPSPRNIPAEIPPAPAIRTVESTAYCLTGQMANGDLVHDGAVAMNGVPFGARWRILSGPFSGRVLTVKDRIGHSSDFDVAMPGRCDEALGYGRRSIEIERVS